MDILRKSLEENNTDDNVEIQTEVDHPIRKKNKLVLKKAMLIF